MTSIYYTPPPIDTPLGIQICSAGSFTGRTEPLSVVTPYYNIVYYTRGRGSHCRNGVKIASFGPGSITVSEPGMKVERRTLPGHPIDASSVAFRGPTAEALFARYNSATPHLFSDGGDAGYRSYFTRINAALKSGTPDNMLKAHAVLIELIIETLRKKRLAAGTPARDDVHDFMEFAERHRNSETLPIESFIEKRKMSYESFRKKFRKISGMSPHDFWLQAKLSAAKKMLLESTLTVETIAENVGIMNPSYFSRLFIRKEGISPSVFRSRDGGAL
ncbi:MAG: helix-turn-helix transcriptional regulator [Spirochaetes bacterium]|nr:helix-turn-helix transcriptional regulator [Spirochaetota bacterium]